MKYTIKNTFFVQNFPSMDIQIVLSKAAALAGKTFSRQ